jgi:23S rRNA (adenine2030-N6)-methyltransferase
MNYRHAFHAGSFADVVKHAVMVRILVHLRSKPAAFRVLDTHAGAGMYDLAGVEASRGGEWRDGIGRLLAAPIAADARSLLEPYLDVVNAVNVAGSISVYPGSPALVQAFLRPQDRMIACELEPDAAAALARRLSGDRRSKAVAIDGWTALNAYIPPKERRGLVLIDPPFEDAGDFPRLARTLSAAHRKWTTGTYLAWYPIKKQSAPEALARGLAGAGIAKILRAELSVAASGSRSDASPAPAAIHSRRLDACGLIVINPPWSLTRELAVLLPALAAALSGGSGAHRLDWLTAES